MANEYTEKQILDEFQSEKPYQRRCVNYNGETECDINGERKSIPYIEIIAEFILSKIKANKHYDLQKYNHVRKSFGFNPRNLDISEGTEKHLCRKWYAKGFNDSRITEVLGIPFECELNIVEGTKVNVDLISYFAGEGEPVLYLIEVKGTQPTDKENRQFYSSDETLLRCALEIETYWESLEQEFPKMIQDLSKTAKKKGIIFGDMTRVRVKKAILIPSETHAAKQFSDPEKYKNVHALLKNWDIKVVVYDKNIKLPQ